MTHGRIETTPEQQLAELRQAYARYSTLAERLHADDAADAQVREARERNARRIALAYEKTIASTAQRMESIHRTHADGAGFTRLARGLSGMLAGAVIVCGALVAYLRPDIGEALVALIPAQEAPVAPVTVRVARAAPAPAIPAAAIPAPAVSLPLAPSPRPAQTKDQAKPALKPAAKPAIAPPNESAKAPQREARREEPRANAPPVAPVRAPLVTAPVKTDSVKAVEPPAPSPTRPAQLAAAPQAPVVQTPAPQATVEPLSPPRDVAALPSPPQTVDSPQSGVQVIETPAAPVTASAARTPQASSRPVPVVRTHLKPPYPLDAKRAGEQGTTQMEVAISAPGAITDCKVIGTSGSERLDSTACSFVKRYWRWQPRDTPGTTKISVVWNLISGR